MAYANSADPDQTAPDRTHDRMIVDSDVKPCLK